MAILRLEVCEVCHVIGKPVKKYRIGDEDRLTRMPLCDEDAQPIVRLLDLKRPVRRAVNKPTTMEEVRARKTAARKAPPKVKRTR